MTASARFAFDRTVAEDPNNPYAPPLATISVPAPLVEPHALASRAQRLGGAIIDGFLTSAGLLVAMVGTNTSSLAEVGEDNPLTMYTSTGSFGVVAGFWVLGVTALHAYLVTTRGQSVGKIAVNTRIVRANGSKVDFLHGVLLRNWLLQGLAFVPLVGNLIGLVDAAFIFKKDHRCAHDHIADTVVIRL